MNLREVFAEAIQIENIHDRQKYLDQACGDDHILRQQVEQLLADHANLGSFLESDNSPTESFTAGKETPKPLPMPTHIGPYRLLEEIGSGGMGIVYLAHQSKPVDRRVALKLIKPGMDTRQVLARFEAERQALAMMDHPNIAKVLDAGQTENGNPYFVMELVNGVPITEFCDQYHLSTKERLELFIPVCMAIQHAHQKGVIHRDLKPSNILVTLYDDKPVPKIIDFGIAKATHQRLTEQTLFTAFGHIIGTFEYMSPEQATRNQLDVDTRSDVYSLGVVLYELLTGETPIDRQRLRNAAWDEMLRIIREEDPPLASSKLSSSVKLPSVAANRRTEPAKLSAFIRGELDWIAAKALEKNRARRYESASSFAEDIRRFLKDEPVLACPPTFAYRFRKFLSKHRTAVTVGALFFGIILMGLVGTIWQTKVAIDMRNMALFREHAAKLAKEEEAKQRKMAEANRIEAENARRDSESRMARLNLERGLHQIDSNPHSGLPWLIEAMRIEPKESPAASLHRLRVQGMIQELPTLLAYLPATSPIFNSANTQLAVIRDEKNVELYMLPAMKRVAELQHSVPVHHISFSPEGDFLVTVAGIEGAERFARLWNTTDGSPLSDNIDLIETEHGMKDIPTVTISPDAKRLTVIWAGMYNRWHSKMVAKVYDRHTLKPISPTFAHHSDLDLGSGYHSLSHDGTRVLLPRGLPASDTRAAWQNPDFPEDINQVQQYDLLSGKPVHPPLPDIQDFYDFPIYDAHSTLIATQATGQIKIWNAADGTLLHQLIVPPPVAHMQLTFHPDGKELLALDRNRAILWELGKNEPILNWDHKDQFTIDKHFTQIIYKSTHGNSYHEFIQRSQEEDTKQNVINNYGRAWFSEDGSKYVLEQPRPINDATNEVAPSQIFDATTGRTLSPPWKMSSTIFHESFISSKGRYLVAIQNGLLIWDLEKRNTYVHEYPADSELVVTAASRNESQTAISILDNKRNITVLDTNTEHLLYPTLSVDNEWNRDEILLSPDATYLLQLQDSKRLTLWDLKKGIAIWKDKKIREEEHWISEIKFVDGGTKLAILETVHHQPDKTKELDFITNLHVVPIETPDFKEPELGFGTEANVTLRQYANRIILTQIKALDSADTQAKSPPKLHLISLDTLKDITQPLSIPKIDEIDFDFTPDGSKLILANGEIWDVKSNQLIREALMQQRADNILVRETGNEFLLATEGGDSLWSATGTISRFSLDGKNLSTKMKSPSSGSLVPCYHPNQDILGSTTSGLRLWDLYTSTPITRNLELIGHRQPNTAVFFSPDGSRLYSVGDKVTILNLQNLATTIPADDVLEAWAKLLSGKQVDTLGGLVDLSTAEIEAVWKVIEPAVRSDVIP
jgi:serine/threonine protein kinase/WD40 repeat protein